MKIKDVFIKKESKEKSKEKVEKRMEDSCIHSPIAKNSTLIMSNRTSMVFPAEYRFVCKECGKQFTYYKRANGSFILDIKETPEYSDCKGIVNK